MLNSIFFILLVIISSLLFLSYCIFLLISLFTFHKRIGKRESSAVLKLPFVSVIIVGRNEALNIRTCLSSVFKNNYNSDKFEIIYVDDNSTDNSIEILKGINEYNFKFYELKDFENSGQNSFKKAGIKFGILKSKGEILLFTDADAIVTPHWIESHVEKFVINHDLKMCTGPVLYHENTGFIKQFQYYDLIATAGFTGLGILKGLYFIANGANMSIRREVFADKLIKNNLASGDDVFMIQNLASKDKKSVSYLNSKDSVVTTYPENNLRDLLRQRIRWGSKTGYYNDSNLKIILGLLFTLHLLSSFGLFVLLSISLELGSFIMLLILIKNVIEVWYLKKLSIFFAKKFNILSAWLMLLIYPFYFVIIGCISLSTKEYIWKGRKVK
jgi:poly-beta-1,6-N-acetyl-D-glucosamine synthase